MNKEIAFWTSAGFVIGYITCKYINRKCGSEILIESEKAKKDLQKVSLKCSEQIVTRNTNVYTANENYPDLRGNK